MKKILLSAIMITFGMCTYAQNSIKIPVGKNIPVTLTSEIYSNSRASQQVSATVSNDIKADDGTVVIRRGTPVNINAEIKKAKGVGKGASVRLDIISTTAVDGQTIYLQGLFQRHGNDRKGAALGVGLGTGLTVLCPVGLFFLCIKGEKVTIPEGTIITNVVTADTYNIAI